MTKFALLIKLVKTPMLIDKIFIIGDEVINSLNSNTLMVKQLS